MSALDANYPAKQEESELDILKRKNTDLLGELKEAKKQFRQLQHKIDINQYEDSDKDIEFYTGFKNYEMLLTCFKLIEDAAKSLNYGTYQCKLNESNHHVPRLGRRRALDTFQEFVLVLMRLRLGIIERDLGHRFGVSESTVSVIIRTWLKFLRSEFGPLIGLPSREITFKTS